MYRTAAEAELNFEGFRIPCGVSDERGFEYLMGIRWKRLVNMLSFGEIKKRKKLAVIK